MITRRVRGITSENICLNGQYEIVYNKQTEI